MIRTVLGVDPGKSSAALALFGYRDSPRPRLITTAEIPTFPDGQRIDWFWLQDWCQMWRPDIAYIENATAMGEGTVSGYLKAAGAIEAAISLSGIDSVYVMPSIWLRELGLIGKTKNDSVDLARKLFPEHAETTFKFYKSHNSAQAALLALYGGIRTDLVQIRTAA